MEAFLFLSGNELRIDLAIFELAQQEVMVIEFRHIVRRQSGRRASRNWTLPYVMPKFLTILAIGTHFLVEATFELRRHGTVLRRLGKGSKSICPKVPCVVEENFFVQVFSHCHIEHALDHTLKLLL